MICNRGTSSWLSHNSYLVRISTKSSNIISEKYKIIDKHKYLWETRGPDYKSWESYNYRIQFHPFNVDCIYYFFCVGLCVLIIQVYHVSYFFLTNFKWEDKIWLKIFRCSSFYVYFKYLHRRSLNMSL